MPGTHILIIGGGANGVAAFVQLVSELIVRGLHQNLILSVVERHNVIGEGLAFGTKQPGHLLNTQSGMMGIHPYEPGHYSNWLTANKHLVPEDEIKQYEDPEDSYTTRRLYSVYLQECFATYLTVAEQHGIEVNWVNGEATDVQVSPQGYRVIIDGAGSLACDVVILAPGTPRPNNYAELDSVEKYIDFPWPSNRLLSIPQDATVGILGTSLSAIDAVMTLVDNNHAGKISLVSPDGLLPRVQPRKESDYACTYLTLSTLHAIRRKALRSPTVFELFRVFRDEVHHYFGREVCWQNLKRKNKRAQSLLDQDIAAAEQGGDGVLNVVYATRDISETVWSWLSIEEKLRFRRWLGIDWQTTRHAMPMHNARRLRHLFLLDQLAVYSQLTEVRYDEGVFHSIVGTETITTEYLINATGPGNRVDEMKSTLINNLSNSGLIESYPAGGIRINTDTMQVVSSRCRTEGLYAIGHLANGMLIDSNAVWFNIKKIASMVQHIISQRSDH